MSIIKSISAGFKNYVNFGGYSSRPDFWWFLGFNFLIYQGALLLGSVVFPNHDIYEDGLGSYLLAQMFSYIVIAIFFIPILSNATRRIRDAGYNPLWMLCLLIPVGFVYILWCCGQPSIRIGIDKPKPSNNG